MIYPATFEQKIGFDRLREQVAARCTMRAARERLAAEGFSTSAREIERRLALADEMRLLLDMEHESLADLNALAQATNNFSTDDIKKLGAAVTLAKPQNAEQVKNLVENLDLFDFAPDAHSPAEYGKYMIQQSSH